ncbi:hypothetical protein PTTG_26024, partial [Puccinia triticina 1-1 BBBD Race 1]
HYQARGCTLGRDMKMDLSDMLELWKEWGGSVRQKKVKRSDSKWAPKNLPTRSAGAARPKPNLRPVASRSNSPAERAEKGKKRQSLAEVDGLPFKRRASPSTEHPAMTDPSLSADMINMTDMWAGEISFNTCMSEKMNPTDCKQAHFV